MKALNNKTVVALSVVIILFPLGYSAVCSVFIRDANPSEPFLVYPDGEFCVDGMDRTYMRFHHMDFLKDIRDKAMREGIRGDAGFGEGTDRCRDCHTYRDQFCDRCHTAVDLHLDCFGCHYYPTSPGSDD